MPVRRSLALALAAALVAGGVSCSPSEGASGVGSERPDRAATGDDLHLPTADPVAPPSSASPRETGPRTPVRASEAKCGQSLAASARKVRIVGALRLTELCGGIADVAAAGDYAYLHAWKPYCTSRGSGGTFVVDVSDPRRPRRVGFIPSHEGSYPGEGGAGEGSVVRVRTRHFNGWLLVRNNERCSSEGVGGFDLIDVTDPRHPKRLTIGYGDFDAAGEDAANDTHQVFLWQQEQRAFVITTDNEEGENVDIYDVTNPRRPRKVAETGIGEWPGVQERLAYGARTTHHQPIVAKIDGDWTALLSYWDAGWVKLNLSDPARPRFIGDSDYPASDPVNSVTPEGNAHSADWSHTREFILAADEDFTRRRVEPVEITSGPSAGTMFPSAEFDWTEGVEELPEETVNGPTVYGGYACTDAGRDGVPDPSTAGRVGRREERILVVQRGPLQDPTHRQPPCYFSDKVQAAQEAGWDAVVVANHHVGAEAAGSADAFLCGSQAEDLNPTIPGLCVGHRAMHLIFGTEPSYAVPYAPTGSDEPTEPRVGQRGAEISARRRFDGWGYVHLLDADTMEHLDALAPDFTSRAAFDTGFGWLSVHDPVADPDRDLAYMAWYAGGLRVARFGRWGIEEVGHYVTTGADYWGAAVGDDDSRRGKGLPGGTRVILVADRSYGLRIFRYVGPGAANVP